MWYSTSPQGEDMLPGDAAYGRVGPSLIRRDGVGATGGEDGSNCSEVSTECRLGGFCRAVWLPIEQCLLRSEGPGR